jgi:tetratricopeptide (TPR) repeat protein
LGSWDVSVFGNDEAREWLSELILSTSTEPIFRALVNAAKVRDTEYLQAPECERALAAAELVASARGKPGSEIPPALTTWLSEQKFVAGTQIADLAIRVLDRIAANSELRELWADTDSAEDWENTVRNLQQRLRETREISIERDRTEEVSVEDLCEEAAVFVAEHRFTEALAKYEQALSLEPKSPTVFMGRAICHLWMQQYERVIEDINKALSQGGDPIADAYNLRSQAFFHLKKYKNVVADLSTYLRARPQHNEGYLIRAMAYENLEQFPNAINDYTVLIERKSHEHLHDAFMHRALCYEQIGRHDLAAWDRQRATQLESATAHLP